MTDEVCTDVYFRCFEAHSSRRIPVGLEADMSGLVVKRAEDD